MTNHTTENLMSTPEPTPEPRPLMQAIKKAEANQSKKKALKKMPRAQSVPLPLEVAILLVEAAESGTDPHGATAAWDEAIEAAKKRIGIYARLS